MFYDSGFAAFIEASAAVEVLESQLASSQQLPAPEDVLALVGRNPAILHFPAGEVENLVHALKLVGHILAVAANLAAECLDFQVDRWPQGDPGRRVNRIDGPHPHLRSLELVARLGFAGEHSCKAGRL